MRHTTGKEMRDSQYVLGVSGKYVRRNMSLASVGVLGQAEMPTDADDDGSEGYNPYDHMPAETAC